MNQAPAIELRDLRKTYKKGRELVHAVDGLDLVVGWLLCGNQMSDARAARWRSG